MIAAILADLQKKEWPERNELGYAYKTRHKFDGFGWKCKSNELKHPIGLILSKT